MEKLDKNLKILILIAVIVITSVGIFGIKTQLEVEELASFSTPTLLPENKVSLIIDNGTASPKDFTVEINQESTVFDLLKRITKESGIGLTTKSYSAGIFIEAIGDKKNGDEGKYWLYYVNGEMPSVAADKKQIKPGDKIEFKFQESSF